MTALLAFHASRIGRVETMDLVDTVTDEIISTGHHVERVGRTCYVDGREVAAAIFPAAPELIFTTNTRFAYAPAGLFA